MLMSVSANEASIHLSQATNMSNPVEGTTN